MSEPTVHIFEDGEAMSRYAAAAFVAAAHSAKVERGVFSAALAGGGTPQRFFELLGAPAYAQQIDWATVHLFWGDERMVAPDAGGSNYKQFKEAVIDHVSIPSENIHRIHGELPAEAASQNYAEQLAAFANDGEQWPKLDLVMLGLGGDGHTASLFPQSPIVNDAPTRAVVADYDGRPAERVTLTEGVINDARAVWFMVKGRGKAEIVHEVVAGERDLARLPGQRIRPKNGTLTFLLDSAAAAHLTN